MRNILCVLAMTFLAVSIYGCASSSKKIINSAVSKEYVVKQVDGDIKAIHNGQGLLSIDVKKKELRPLVEKTTNTIETTNRSGGNSSFLLTFWNPFAWLSGDLLGYKELVGNKYTSTSDEVSEKEYNPTWHDVANPSGIPVSLTFDPGCHQSCKISTVNGIANFSVVDALIEDGVGAIKDPVAIKISADIGSSQLSKTIDTMITISPNEINNELSGRKKEIKLALERKRERHAIEIARARDSGSQSLQEKIVELCEAMSSGTSLDSLRCKNSTVSKSESLVTAIYHHCQSYESPGKKLACFEAGKTLLGSRDAQQIANYEDSCQGSKGKVKADCYSEVYEQVGIKQASEQAQAALVAKQNQQAENYAAQQRQQQESRVEQRNAIAANCRKRCSDNYSNCMSSALTSTLSSGIMSLATGGNAYTQAMGLRSSTQPLTCQINKSTCESGC